MFRKIAYGAFLGAAISGIAHITPWMWEFYVIIIPTVILVEWKSYFSEMYNQ